MLARARNEAGMTLVEILIAMAILGVGLSALASAIPLSTYGIQEGNQTTTATFLANQRLEEVRNARWAGTAACPVPAGSFDELGVSASASVAPQSCGATTFPDESAVASPYAQYSRQVRIIDCGTGAGCQGVVSSNLRLVTVTVGYRPLTGVGQAPATKQMGVTMLIAKR
jgi:prepilin-type N-terminal cleavage/methylation domain-containing protein